MREYGIRAVSRAGMAALALTALACSPTIDSRGYLMSRDRVAEIEPGVQTRADVADILGSPSAQSTFDDSKWYYVGERTETVAFFKPKVLERLVLVVEFDESGEVEALREYDLEDGRLIQLVERTTPTAGKDMTFLEQFIGNIGRFNSP